MNRIAVAVVALILAVPCIVAQEDEPKVELDPNIKLMALYDTPGRAWSARVVHWSRGESPFVVKMHSKVDKVEDGRASVTTVHENDWGADSETIATFNLTETPEGLQQWADKRLPVETLDMGFRKFECRRHTIETDGVQTTTWISTEFHPLMVKQFVSNGRDYSVSKLTAFHDGEVDPWLLYRVPGRTMVTEVGTEEDEFTVRTRVDACDDTGADLTSVRVDAEGNQVGDAETARVDFTRRLRMVIPEGVDEVVSAGHEEIKTAAGTFDCYKVEHELGTLYFSSVWTELPVKVETDEASMELIEFDLGHDATKFYRTVGNSYSMKSTTTMPGFNTAYTMRYEVTSVSETTSNYVLKMYDENGTLLNTSKLEFPLPEAVELEEGERPAPANPYTGEVEELIQTPAGNFPAIRIELDGVKMWTWNGITVRSLFNTDDIQTTQELTECDIQ